MKTLRESGEQEKVIPASIKLKKLTNNTKHIFSKKSYILAYISWQ